MGQSFDIFAGFAVLRDFFLHVAIEFFLLSVLLRVQIVVVSLLGLPCCFFLGFNLLCHLAEGSGVVSVSLRYYLLFLSFFDYHFLVVFHPLLRHFDVSRLLSRGQFAFACKLVLSTLVNSDYLLCPAVGLRLEVSVFLLLALLDCFL